MSCRAPRTSRLRRWTSFGATLAVLGATLLLPAASALADPPRAPGPRTQPADIPQARSRDVVRVVIGTLPWGVDAAELRSRLSRELRTDVVTTVPDGRVARGTLYLDTTPANEISARFEAADGTVTERKIALPSEHARAADTIVLVSGNIARDEAAELRAALKRRGDATADSAPSDPRDDGSSAEPPPGAVAGGDADADSNGDSDPDTDAPARTPITSHAAAAGHTSPSPAVSRWPETPHICAAPRATQAWFGGDFLPMMGSSIADRKMVRNFSFNLIGGLSGGTTGGEIGSTFNIDVGHLCGAQLAGAGNVVTGIMRGFQVGGAWNYVGEGVSGLQVGGALNIGGPLDGGQISGGLNIAGAVRGFQIGGGANIARGVRGVQIGTIDVAAGDVWGAQLGVIHVAAGNLSGTQVGAIDIAAGDVAGAQLGVLEIATGDLAGTQLGAIQIASNVKGFQAGVVNIAKRVQGAQIGVVNVAEDSDFSLGLLSIVRRGRLHLDVWGAETGLFTAALKHGGRYFHNFYGVGLRPLDGELRVAFTLGFGGHFPLPKMFHLDVDGFFYTLHRTNDFEASTALLSQLRVVAGMRVARGFAVFAGPSYNVITAQQMADTEISALGSSVFRTGPGWAVRGWPGIVLGVQTF